MTNEVIKAMIERRSCRKFKAEQIKDEELQAILEAGKYAATGKGLQSPKMVFIQNPEVIAKYAGTVAVECFGIVGMAAVNMKDGLVHLLKKESLTRGIHVNISDDNHISIDFHIIVAYGVSISAVTDNLISDVKYRVEEFSGMQVDKINVYIEGVRVID